jgi:hypothetical protein
VPSKAIGTLHVRRDDNDLGWVKVATNRRIDNSPRILLLCDYPEGLRIGSHQIESGLVQPLNRTPSDLMAKLAARIA